MKKLLLLTLIATASLPLFAQVFDPKTILGDSSQAATLFSKFIDLEKNHKDDWLNLAQEEETAKFTMIKNHHDAWADFKSRLLKNVAKGDSLSLNDVTNAIALHKKQKQDWKTFSTKFQDKKVATVKKHAEELANFEYNNGLTMSISGKIK